MRASYHYNSRPHTTREKEHLSRKMKAWHKTHTHPLQGRELSRETKMKLSLTLRGRGNPNWKGGLTELIRGIRRSPELYQWRKEVLERDNYTCRDCKVTKSMEAHHIRSVIDYPKGIFEVDNGLTLCKDCHKRHTSWQWLKRRRRIKNEHNPIH